MNVPVTSFYAKSFNLKDDLSLFYKFSTAHSDIKFGIFFTPEGNKNVKEIQEIKPVDTVPSQLGQIVGTVHPPSSGSVELRWVTKYIPN